MSMVLAILCNLVYDDNYPSFCVISSLQFLSWHFQAAEIERRIEQETKAEKHIQKLLLLGISKSSLFLIALIIWHSRLFHTMLIV